MNTEAAKPTPRPQPQKAVFQPTPHTMVSVKWVAKRLGVQPAVVYRMVADAEHLRFPVLRINSRTLRFDPVEIEAYIQRQTISPK